MRKHSKNRKSGFRRSRNANVRLPESAANYVSELITELGDSEEFSFSYLRQEYLSKYLSEDLVPADDRKNNAIAKWLLTEEQNLVTNEMIKNRDPQYNVLPRVSYSSFLKFARKLISSILGPLHDNLVLGSLSGGASTSRRKTESSPAHKFTGKVDTTEAASQYIHLVDRLAPLLRQHGAFVSLKEVAGAVLFTVPKKTDIDRCACKEPDFNMFLQKGVGSHIRRRLRRVGINLNDQSVNRSLARKGAVDSSLATIDLSSASDTITIEAVRALLPEEWFLYLNDIRSHVVRVGEEDVRTQMFSSMGNGFTFELESLLFYALTRSALYFTGVPGIVSVYGDDIICPSEGYDQVSWTLREFGFSLNAKKSFATGFFRESCGGHYYGPEDVTPFYLKRKATHLTDVIRVANQLRRWALADPARQFMVPSTYKVWTQLASFVPLDLWGGYDLDTDTQLVSPGAPINRLMRLTKPRKEPETGRYVHWHNTNWKREQPGESAPEPVDADSKLCRRISSRNGAPYCASQFHEELMASTGSV